MVAKSELIIVVDDNPSMSQAMARLLSAAGWTVLAFQSAEEMLEAAVSGNADCMVFDIELPGMSGLELQSHLSANGFGPPVIFITGHDRPYIRERAEQTGVAYLTKPFPAHELINAVRRHLVPRSDPSNPPL